MWHKAQNFHLKGYVMTKILALLLIFQTSIVQAVTIKDFKNNKEAFSRSLTKKDFSRINFYIRNHHLSENELIKKSINAFENLIIESDKSDNWCELSFIEKFKYKALSHNLIDDRDEFGIFIKFLRSKNIIDDLLLNNIQQFDFLENQIWSIDQKFNSHFLPKEDLVLSKIYSSFISWPSEEKKCLQNYYENFVSKIQENYKRSDSKYIGRLNYQAYTKSIISEKTYQKLESIRFGNFINEDLSLNSYIKNLKTVKDKLSSTPEENTETTFSEVYVYRRSNLTRRGKLYTEYTNTQILLMSQLIEKTAKRIDAKQVHLYFQYDDSNLENETYIFSPMEQYRIAVKMLRKDMAELRRSEIFKNTPVYYEDIIAAAYETGAVTSKELDYVLKFDDLWNPKISRWRGIASLTLSIAGTGTFLLPTPFNYIGAIALIFTQSRLAGGQKTENPEDNENVII